MPTSWSPSLRDITLAHWASPRFSQVQHPSVWVLAPGCSLVSLWHSLPTYRGVSERSNLSSRHHSSCNTIHVPLTSSIVRHPWFIVPQTLFIVPLTSFIIPQTSFSMLQTLFIIPQTWASIVLETSSIKPPTSFAVHEALSIIPHTWFVVPQTLPVEPQTLPIEPQTSFAALHCKALRCLALQCNVAL